MKILQELGLKVLIRSIHCGQIMHMQLKALEDYLFSHSSAKILSCLFYLNKGKMADNSRLDNSKGLYTYQDDFQDTLIFIIKRRICFSFLQFQKDRSLYTKFAVLCQGPYFYSCNYSNLKQTQQQYTSMKIKHFLPFLMLVLLATAQEAEIIDFTYTHVLQEGGASSDLTDKIVIYPDSKQIEKHSFPEICDLKDKLDEGMDQSSMAARAIDVDEHLKNLRSKVLQLLRLLEEMKNVKAALSEIQEEYDPEMEGFNSTHFSLDLKRLADKQVQLAAQRKGIENATAQLNLMIEAYNLNPKNQQFNEVSLRYQISFANSKIAFYENLKNSIQNKKSKKSPPVNYTEFFSSLKKQFDQANHHLDDIDNAINNYANKKVLEEKIASWKNKIEIEKLLLTEKIDCNISKTKIKNHNYFNEEIKKTFNDLREKKKEFAGMNNTQCQGVAKKLEEKIRSELKITNRAFLCSEGLQQTQQNLERKQAELENLKQKLQDLKIGELELYQQNYNRTVADIQKELEIMRRFTVDEYVHSEAEIGKLLQDARNAKENAEKALKALSNGPTSTTNFKDLEELVQLIKKQKARYCKEFSSYEQDSREVWNKVYRQEKRQRQLAHLRSQYIAYGERFIALESQYKHVTNEIIQYLALYQQKE